MEYVWGYTGRSAGVTASRTRTAASKAGTRRHSEKLGK
jgi:hypothetical protein